MSEPLTPKQIALAEHKKANDALRELKALQAAISFMVIPNFIVPTQPSDATVANLIKISDRTPQYMDILSNYLSNQFKEIMKSNDKKTQSTFKPIKTKGFSKEIEYGKRKRVKKIKQRPNTEIKKKKQHKRKRIQKTY